MPDLFLFHFADQLPDICFENSWHLVLHSFKSKDFFFFDKHLTRCLFILCCCFDGFSQMALHFPPNQLCPVQMLLFIWCHIISHDMPFICDAYSFFQISSVKVLFNCHLWVEGWKQQTGSTLISCFCSALPWRLKDQRIYQLWKS